MSRDNKIINAKIYKVGQKLGLNKEEIENILTNSSSTNELTSQMLRYGPDEPYWSSMYGSISNKVF